MVRLHLWHARGSHATNPTTAASTQLVALRTRRPVAAALLAALVVVAGCSNGRAAFHRDRSGSAGVVAWTSTPAPPTSPSTTTTTTLAPALPCARSSLGIEPGRGAAAAGNELSNAVLTNIGQTTCRLSGYPRVFGVTTTGERVLIRTGHSPFFPNLVPADIRPGHKASVFISGADVCLGETTSTDGLRAVPYRRLLLVLPHHEGSVVMKSFPPCEPLAVSRVGVEPPSVSPPAPPPGSLQSLRATTKLHEDVQGGQVLHYVVTLTNPDQKAVFLSSCPGYTEFLGLIAGMHVRVKKHSYDLNCRPVRRILPRHSVSFAMEIPVPRVAKPTQAKFGWSLDVAGIGPGVGGAVTVEPTG